MSLLDEGDMREVGRRLRAAASEAEDLLLVYYSGHGLVGGKRHELYLALRDSVWDAPEFSSLDYVKLSDAVRDSPAKMKLIVLDCCFSGRALDNAMGDAATVVLGQLDVQGTYVLTSAQRDQVALALSGEEFTAFSGRLLKLLEEGIPGGAIHLTVDALYQRLRAVMKSSGLPAPEKRATQTSEDIVLGRNPAYSPAAPHSVEPVHSSVVGAGLRAEEWNAFRSDRGNSDREYVAFEGHKELYWVVVGLVAALIGVLAIVVIDADFHLIWKLLLVGVGAILVLAGVGFSQVARSPARLEVGEQGLQLFARSGATWLPWSVITHVAVRRVDGIPHVVAWLREAEIFPDFDAFGGGPTFLPKIGAVGICSVSVLKASRQEITRALMYYGRDKFRASASAASQPPIDMSGDRWDDVLTVARQVETDQVTRPVERQLSGPDQAAVVRDAVSDALHKSSQGRPVAPHVEPWVWTPDLGGHPLTEVGRRTGIELRLSPYPEHSSPSPGPVVLTSIPAGGRKASLGLGRIVWRVTLSFIVAFFAIMTIGAIGAWVTGEFPDVMSAIISNVIFDGLFVVFGLLLTKELRLFWWRKR